MKKRVLSMFMALALCLTLLPAPAWAAEADAPEGRAAQIGETVYSTLPEAVNAAQDGDTIKLLADYKTAEGAGEEGESGLPITKSVTLDLNGYKMDDFRVVQVNDAAETLPSGNLTVEDTSEAQTGKVTGMIKLLAGKLTINGGTIGDDRDGVEIEKGTLTVNGGTIGFLYGDAGSGTVTITGGAVKNARFGEGFNITVTGGSGHTGLWDVSEGTWNISGGEFEGVTFLTESPANNATISGGTFGRITRQILKPGGNSEEVPAQLSGLLADGYAFYWPTDSGEYDRYVELFDTTTYLDNVQVKPHTHTITGNNNVCTECGKEFAASVTQNGAVTYYEDFNAALSAAKAGDTLTLLTDVRSDAALVAIDKAIILDLNGHEIEGLEVEAKATIKDSGETKGTIGTLEVFDNGLTFGDLLEPGYAFRTANAWCIETKEGVVCDVTVQQAPITSVTLTALNADNTAASTTIPYGTTGGIKLFAHCDPKPGVTELSCQWYTIGDSAVLIEGAKGTEYNLPDNLSVGEHTYRVTFTADGYTKSADITITVAPADLSQGAVVFTQTAEKFAGTMGNIRDGKGTFVFTPYGGHAASATELSYLFEVSCNGRTLTAGSDYTVTGGSTAKWAGTHTLTIEGKGNYTGTATHTWRIEPYKLTRGNYRPPTITKVYDGTTGFDFSKAGNWGIFTENVAHRPNDEKTGKNPVLGADGNAISIYLKPEDFKASAVTLDSPDAGDRTASFTIELKTRDGQREPNFVFEDGGSPTIQVTGAAASITKAPAPTGLANGALTVYNGTAKTYEIDIASLLPSPGAGCRYGEIYDSQTISFNTYKTEITEIKLNSSYYDATANKAKIEKGKLILPIQNVNTTTTGKIGTIKLDVISQNYHQIKDWTIDVSAANQPVSSSGGGSGKTDRPGTVKTDTVTNPDGSVTKTETKSDGTVIETTTGKDGSTTKTETKKDGSSVTESKDAAGSTGTVKTDKHGQTTAETTLSSKAIETAKKSGEAVKAPVEVEASRDSNTAPTVKIELPRNSGDTKVEIPVSNVKPGTVAVLVHADGTEEIVKNSLPTADGIQLTVNGGATVKIVDNSKDFIDTRNHWAKDAIDFVSARELVNGMNDSIYAPNNSTTRAQLWTILARQNDADLNGGNTWYEKAQLWSKNKGISDGTESNAAINRAQMVTMLWRAAGSPAAQSGTAFQDVAAGSYYAQAVAWAVEGGITAGVGGGRFDPAATCTRAQIATFLYRTYQGK